MREDPVFSLVVLGIMALLVCSFGAGYFHGTEDACASIQTEWRDKKCVKVIVEEVK